MKKLLSFFLLSLLTITSLNLSYAQMTGDTDDLDSSCINLTNNMRFRSRDANTNNEVSDLQDFLISEGYMTGNTTGYFGLATQKAVRSFQKNNNLISSGIVGAITRAKIKEMSCSGNTTPIVLNPVTPITPSPIACTMEMRYCPNGEAMQRDMSTCRWKSEMCKMSTINTTDYVRNASIDYAKAQLVLGGENFSQNSATYKVNYKFDCPAGSGGCAGALTNYNFISSRELRFNLDRPILMSAYGYISLEVVNIQTGKTISEKLLVNYITPSTITFSLKSPTDGKSLIAGQSYAICWENASNYTDQKINFSIAPANVQIGDGANNVEGAAFLSQKCTQFTVPSNLKSGTYFMIASNSGGAVYSNSPNFEVVNNVADPVINSFNLNPEQNFSLNVSNFASISFKAECGNGVGAAQTIRNGYYADVIYLSGSESICNEYQDYQKMQTSNTLGQEIINQPLSLWRNNTVDGGKTWILSPQDKNISGEYVMKVKVCNVIGKCVEAQAPGKFWAKG